LGSYFIYNLNVDFFGNGNFFDFPQLGLDAESVIITANIFQGNNLLGADMFAIPKSSLYQGLGFSVPVFVGLQATLAPPIVLDQNPTSFLIAAPGGNTLKMYALQNSGSPTISLTGPVDISVPAYAVPPPAPQPGTSQVLDTSDARFVNASTQVGDLLWQVHSIDVANLPTPRWYRISTPAASVLDSGLVFASQTSSDFNASIAANADSDVFLTWTSVDAAGGINPQVRFAGCDHNDPGCVLGAGTDAFTSPSFFSDDRWGDYSAVTIDPTNPHRAWLVNETAQLNHDWSSRIVEIGF